MRQLHETYSAKKSEPSAQIIIVYQKEPHAGQLAFKDIPQPESFEERCELARRMKDEYELPMTVLVDTMEDQSREMFSDLPSPAFVIDREGIIQAKFPWADAETIAPAVEKLKPKKNGLSPAIWVAIFLPLLVIIITRMTQSKANKENAT